MVANNTNETPACDDWFFTIGVKIEIPLYYIIIPIFILFGFFGRFVCLLAYYRRSKKESAYFYQIALTSIETLNLIFFFFECAVMIFCWNPKGGATWFISDYGSMWFAAHLATPLVNMGHTICEFLAVCMAADRILAMWKPLIYRNFNHRRIQLMVLFICIIFGITFSLFDCFRYRSPRVEIGEKYYSIPASMDFLESRAARILSNFRDFMRLSGLVALIVLNIILIYIYHQRVKKIAVMTSSLTTDERKEKSETTLMLLTLFQCFFRSIYIVSIMVYYLILSIKPSFDNCEALLWGPVVDGIAAFIDIADFYCIIIVSKQFRRLIFEHVKLPICH